ncbi:hypothetical protein A2U01_0115028, partial [Trifolium medium]|nr:hypothetical protein [Trifolium medium]
LGSSSCGLFSRVTSTTGLGEACPDGVPAETVSEFFFFAFLAAQSLA